MMVFKILREKMTSHWTCNSKRTTRVFQLDSYSGMLPVPRAAAAITEGATA